MSIIELVLEDDTVALIALIVAAGYAVTHMLNVYGYSINLPSLGLPSLF